VAFLPQDAPVGAKALELATKLRDGKAEPTAQKLQAQ
jgi:hypothetical protein